MSYIHIHTHTHDTVAAHRTVQASPYHGDTREEALGGDGQDLVDGDGLGRRDASAACDQVVHRVERQDHRQHPGQLLLPRVDVLHAQLDHLALGRDQLHRGAVLAVARQVQHRHVGHAGHHQPEDAHRLRRRDDDEEARDQTQPETAHQKPIHFSQIGFVIQRDDDVYEQPEKRL